MRSMRQACCPVRLSTPNGARYCSPAAIAVAANRETKTRKDHDGDRRIQLFPNANEVAVERTQESLWGRGDARWNIAGGTGRTSPASAGASAVAGLSNPLARFAPMVSVHRQRLTSNLANSRCREKASVSSNNPRCARSSSSYRHERRIARLGDDG